MVDVSICILTHNQPDLLPGCVASCYAEIEREGMAGEIIVLDNASADKYPQKLSETFPGIRIIRNEVNLGFSAANNRGILASHGNRVLILNDDTILQPGSLGLMTAALDRDPTIGAIGPKLVNVDGSAQLGFTKRRFPTVKGTLSGLLPIGDLCLRTRIARRILTDWTEMDESGETDYVAGACLLAPRKALDCVGLFDEGFRFFFEDADLCYRLKEHGWKIYYICEARVTHFGSASFSKARQTAQLSVYWQSFLRFSSKHWSPLRHAALRIGLWAVFLLRAPAIMFYKICFTGVKFREGVESAHNSARVAWTLLRS